MDYISLSSSLLATLAIREQASGNNHVHTSVFLFLTNFQHEIFMTVHKVTL